MVATTVPPPGWVPIGAAELQSKARSFLARGLVFSGGAHVVLLALVLWLSAGAGAYVEPKVILRPTDLIPTPTISRPLPPPDAPMAPPQMQDHPDVGILKPLPFDPTKLHIAAPGVSPDRRIENKETGDPTSPTVAAQAVAEPAESDFVAYDAPPVPLFHPDPNYPTWARDAEIQGRVVLHVLVGMDGRVTRIAVRRDVRGLTDAAREAISRWIFRPARSGTHAVAVWVEIPVEFRL